MQGSKAREGGLAYTAVMSGIYNKVTEVCLPSYCGARVQLPSNLHFPEWEALACTPEDVTLISFLKYGFSMGYESPVPTPATHNLASTLQHPRDVATYVLTELDEEVMLGPFDMKPSVP